MTPPRKSPRPRPRPSLVGRDGLIGLAPLGALGLLGLGNVMIWKATFVAVFGDVLESALSLLESLRLPAAGLFDRLSRRIVAERLDVAADVAGFLFGELRLAPRAVALLGAHVRLNDLLRRGSTCWP